MYVRVRNHPRQFRFVLEDEKIRLTKLNHLKQLRYIGSKMFWLLSVTCSMLQITKQPAHENLLKVVYTCVQRYLRHFYKLFWQLQSKLITLESTNGISGWNRLTFCCSVTFQVSTREQNIVKWSQEPLWGRIRLQCTKPPHTLNKLRILFWTFVSYISSITFQSQHRIQRAGIFCFWL